MTATTTPATTSLPALPHWETTPADLTAAVREVKAALRARIAASGRTVEEVFAVIEARVRTRVEEIAAAQARGETIWPVIDYADIAAGTVPAGELAKLRRRGCLVVRGHFPREQALAWDRGIVDYVESNRFFENYRGPGDDFFGSVGSKPEIYPVYWSPAQMQARQSDRMATVQAFLNHQWRNESDGIALVRPRPRLALPGPDPPPPGRRDSSGLGTHLDPGHARPVADAGLPAGVPAPVRRHRRVLRPVGRRLPHGGTAVPRVHDVLGVPHVPGLDRPVGHGPRPGRAAHRPHPGGDGLPDAATAARRRADDDMCGVTVNQVFPASEKWHSLLLQALSGIPDVKAGDSVWWHCDMIHSVAPVRDQRGWGNVMYIPAAPWCPRNEAYAAVVRDAFTTGSSPTDFPAEHYERDWADRFRFGDLNAAGRRGLGIDA